PCFLCFPFPGSLSDWAKEPGLTVPTIRRGGHYCPRDFVEGLAVRKLIPFLLVVAFVGCSPVEEEPESEGAEPSLIPSQPEPEADPVAFFTEPIEKNPRDEVLYRQRGDIYYRREEFDKAIADYTKALELLPAPLTYYNRGVARAAMGDYQ